MTRPDEGPLITKAPLDDEPAGDGGKAADDAEAVDDFLLAALEVRLAAEDAADAAAATVCAVLIMETATAFSWWEFNCIRNRLEKTLVSTK